MTLTIDSINEVDGRIALACVMLLQTAFKENRVEENEKVSHRIYVKRDKTVFIVKH